MKVSGPQGLKISRFEGLMALMFQGQKAEGLKVWRSKGLKVSGSEGLKVSISRFTSGEDHINKAPKKDSVNLVFMSSIKLSLESSFCVDQPLPSSADEQISNGLFC